MVPEIQDGFLIRFSMITPRKDNIFEFYSIHATIIISNPIKCLIFPAFAYKYLRFIQQMNSDTS
jgi:hypothetical protein